MAAITTNVLVNIKITITRHYYSLTFEKIVHLMYISFNLTYNSK